MLLNTFTGFFCTLNSPWDVLLPIIVAIVGIAIGAVTMPLIYKVVKNKKLNDANEQANAIIQEAITKSKNLHKETVLASKEEILKQKAEFDKEVKERRAEIQRSEQRISQREDNLNKKEDILDKKIESIDKSKEDLKKREAEVEAIKSEITASRDALLSEIERAAAMTKEQAKNHLIELYKDDAKKEAARYVREIEAAAKEEADRKAKDIVTIAVQRCAVDHSSEITVSVVNLPNDEMKGRIIGREGRNIRALENATGIDLIIDDTPEAVVLSGFDPIRREVARITLEKLISDGRIHPARIEEMVEKTRRELETQIKEAGENATYEAGVFGIHSDLIKILGRLKYRTSYGQNVLKHSLEVSALAGQLASQLGADVNICKRAGLLHDIGKAVDHEVEGTHISIGVDLAKKYKESNAVVHCIAAHHGDVEPNTVEAILVQVADAISGARPGARRESLDNYVKRLEKLESIANSYTGVEKSFAIQAGREVRIIVKPEVVDDNATVFMAKEIAKQIESEMEYPGQIKVNVIREMRSVEYAK
ncbi:MAG: ribonuclease Y [Clostridiales bacterium]|nr:ribonuclease Y [Clostridiales bacterium]